jgi:hypothetical protein
MKKKPSKPQRTWRDGRIWLLLLGVGLFALVVVLKKGTPVPEGVQGPASAARQAQHLSFGKDSDGQPYSIVVIHFKESTSVKVESDVVTSLGTVSSKGPHHYVVALKPHMTAESAVEFLDGVDVVDRAYPVSKFSQEAQ